MKDILALINQHFPESIVQILKADSHILTSVSAAAPEEMAISFDIEGVLSGKITVFFSDAKAIAHRFLTVTIGDPYAATVEEACHEVSNQALGLLFGSISNAGTDLRLSSYGGKLSDSDALKCLDTGQYLTTLSTDDYGMLHIYYTKAGGENLDDLEADVDESASGNTPPIRVMIVDDSPVMCAFLKKIFSEGNYDIVGIAEDGLEALEKFKELRPELVTLDIMMPKMKGTDVLKEIIAIDPSTTVVMASSVADAKTVMNCLRMGAKRYIVKPYDKQAVIAAIDKALLVKKD